MFLGIFRGGSLVTFCHKKVAFSRKLLISDKFKSEKVFFAKIVFYVLLQDIQLDSLIIVLENIHE